MSTDPTSGSGNIQSSLGATVTQQYPESQLDLPWHQTIITSATTLLWGDPGPAPEIVTLVQSPPFFKDRPVAAATWDPSTFVVDRVPGVRQVLEVSLTHPQLPLRVVVSP